MKTLILIALASTCPACGDDGSANDSDAPTGELTLETCTTTVSGDVPEPYRSLFRCVEMSVDGADLLITLSGLPPHPSYYYGTGSPNYVPWDSRGGAYSPNPNKLVRATTKIAVPLTPVARGVTITAGLVDGVVGSSGGEFRQGVAGVALDSVFLFNPLAAPGDDIADEQFTFDPYNAHPAPGGQYHYHRDSPGPVETGGSAIGVMCDGTWVFGCNELDGTVATLTDVDAQNGHVHAIAGLGDRYHVHICTTSVEHPRPYTPEIQYYDRCTVY